MLTLLGPALLLRSIVGHQYFSILAAALAVIVMDVSRHLHGLTSIDVYEFLHTPLGAIGLATCLSLVLWKRKRWAAVSGSLFSTLTHIPLHAAYTIQFAEKLAQWGNAASAREAGTEVEMLSLLAMFLALLIWGGKLIVRKLFNKTTHG
jgi:hypothetical protein